MKCAAKNHNDQFFFFFFVDDSVAAGPYQGNHVNQNKGKFVNCHDSNLLPRIQTPSHQHCLLGGPVADGGNSISSSRRKKLKKRRKNKTTEYIEQQQEKILRFGLDHI